MMKVYKYLLPFGDHPTVELPAGAEVLDARLMDGPYGDVTIWALVDPAAPAEPRRFRLAGTGHPIEGVVAHIATMVQEVGGQALVWHLFEVAS